MVVSVLRENQRVAIDKIVGRSADPTKTPGLIWHTQGSGKTFTLLSAAQLILEDKASGSRARSGTTSTCSSARRIARWPATWARTSWLQFRTPRASAVTLGTGSVAAACFSALTVGRGSVVAGGLSSRWVEEQFVGVGMVEVEHRAQ
jgi:hypothetical protein